MCRDRWCGLTPQQRFEEARQLTDDLTSIALAGIRATNPDWPEERVRFELTCRRYGRDIAEAAFGSSAR